MKRTEVERLWQKFERTPTGCWEWRAGRTTDGYGQVRAGGRSGLRAHRVFYELIVGPIPDGLVLDHLCRNPPCVNPAHLEPVTVLENTRRGDGSSQFYRRREECKNGHPLSGPNLRIRRDGSRKCAACHRDWQRAYLQRRTA